MSAERVGLLVIRAWIEAGSSSALRAQLRWTTDVSLGFQQSATATEADVVRSAVDAWLAEVLVARKHTT